MSFSTELASLVAGQLTRFITLNRHQLAGQVGNLDFWLLQVRHALSAIDGYGVRFIRLEAAQQQHVTTYDTQEFYLKGETHSRRKASPPQRIPDRELQKARRELVNATSQFLERCHHEELISVTELSAAYKSAGIDSEALDR